MDKVYLLWDDDAQNLAAVCATEEAAEEAAMEFLRASYNPEELEENKTQDGWGDKTMTYYLTRVVKNFKLLRRYGLSIEDRYLRGI